MIKVLLADDHGLVRDGLRALLETHPDIKVVGDAASGRQVLRQAQALRPDVVVMDIAMPEMNGIEATQQIRDVYLSTRVQMPRVLMVSMHSTTEYIFRALRAGAYGYLLKDSVGSEVVDAVRVVHSGRRYLSHKIAAAVVDDYIAERRYTSPLDSLSQRERQILQLVVEGKSSAEMRYCQELCMVM